MPQLTGALHVPLELHVCTPLPVPPSVPVEHWVEPGLQVPTHAPPTHAELVQVDGGPQVPVPLHVETPFTDPPSAPTAHSFDPGEQTP